MREKPPISPQAKESIKDILSQYGKRLEISALESEGFMYLPADHIRIIPPSGKETSGTLEIREPEEKTGTERFDQRDAIEKAWPVGDVTPIAEWENKVFSGELTPPPFNPEVGGRVCLTAINVFETKEGQFVLIPIHPETEQKYQMGQMRKGQAKLSGTNMLRGVRFPTASEITKTALNKVTHNLTDLQAKHREEKIISAPSVFATGLWNVRLIKQKGKFSEIKNCHAERDPSTGTLDLFLIQKQFIFDEFDNFRPQESLPLGLERVNALVALNSLKKAEEDQPLELERLYYAGKQLRDSQQLPKNYQPLFEMRGGKISLKDFKATPPLRAFLKMERRIIEQTTKDLTGEIRQKIGELFEGLLSKALGKEKNVQYFRAEIPESRELEGLLASQPEEFKNWALSLKNKEIVVQPDFILEDGAFMEAKAGGKMELKPEKRDQIFRMVLYKLIKKEELKIRVLTLEGPTTQDSTFNFLKYENIFDTELAEKITEQDLKPIKIWQSSLPK